MRFALVLWFAFSGPVLRGLHAEPIKWRTDYTAARKESRDTGKPLVVEVSRTDCINCVRFNKTVEADPALSAMLNLDCVPTRITDASNPSVVAALKVRQWPTVFIARPDGKIIGMLSGFQEAMNGIGFGLQAAIPAKPLPAALAEQAPPIGPPAFVGAPPVDLIENPGVISNEISKAERLTVNGLEVAAAEGKDRLFGRAGGENDIPADGDFLRLTVVGGTPEERKRVTDDAAGLARWKGAVVVNSYPADHWAIKDLGFVDGSLYVQCPPGKVLHRQALASYGGPGELDGVLAQAEAIRKRDPNYDPKKDPDLRSGADGDTNFSVALAAAIGGGLLLLLIVLGFIALGGYLIVRKKGP